MFSLVVGFVFLGVVLVGVFGFGFSMRGVRVCAAVCVSKHICI